MGKINKDNLQEIITLLRDENDQLRYALSKTVILIRMLVDQKPSEDVIDYIEEVLEENENRQNSHYH